VDIGLQIESAEGVAMLPFRTLLFPVDFSSRCRAIAPVVRETAERFDADLILVHAVDPAPLLMGSVEAPAVLPAHEFAALRRQHEERLKKFQEELFPSMRVTQLVQDGEPGSVVCDAIRHQAADLVMLPTRGHGVFRRFLLGSVTAKVLHDSSAAVWTEAHHAEGTTAATYPYRRVLAALDPDSDEAAAVLRAAAWMAAKYDAGLSLVHAIDTPRANFNAGFAPYIKAILDAADEKMRRLCRESGLRAPYEIVQGDAAAEIGRVAREQMADLVVAGRGHSQAGLSRAWSQLYPIVREAPCPVLSI
jgi:nucleotide-binding universal stress UspA family protein